MTSSLVTVGSKSLSCVLKCDTKPKIRVWNNLGFFNSLFSSSKNNFIKSPSSSGNAV